VPVQLPFEYSPEYVKGMLGETNTTIELCDKLVDRLIVQTMESKEVIDDVLETIL